MSDNARRADWQSALPTSTDYDQIAEEYARHRRVHPGVFEALCGAALPASRVLEVGCGTGNYIIALQTQTGCACWGIDPSSEMLATAHARARATPVVFQLGRAERLPYRRAAYDLVFSVDVIHHVTDRAAHYGEAYRVLDAGGRVCTVTDSEWIIRHREPLSTCFPETVGPELVRYPRVDSLHEAMVKAGFDEIVTHTVEFASALTDIQIYRDRAFSALHLISEEAFQRGIERLERDLQDGPIPCVSRYTLLWGTKDNP